MAQSFLPQQKDTRTFGALQARLLDDLNRPDLSAEVIDYLQDAIRFWSRKPFFFTEIDNTAVPTWQPQTMYPLGSVIHRRVGDIEYAFVAMSVGTQQSGETEPEWTEDEFLQWPGSEFYQPPELDWWGIVADNDVIWANIGFYRHGYHTQLCTVPNVNQYVPPIDYVAPYLVQMTTANLRLILEQVAFVQLSAWDVIRPAPIAAYPRFWSYWQQNLYFWVYPAGFYPVTLNYYAAPLPPRNADDINYWTTTAERLIRKTAQTAISREILYDQGATQLAMAGTVEELSQLKAQAVAQQGYRIRPGEW